MWVLEGDGNLFNGKKLWLKPGTSLLIGRVKSPGAQCLTIDNKSVSRKHLVISIQPALEGSGANVLQKSVLKIRDSSKIGTSLDGEEKFVGQERTLNKDEHSIKLGSYDVLLRIKWTPIVFTLASPSKKLADPTEPLRARLEQFDIKVILEYDVKQTSHVISAKRNTAKGLQALINGKWIVTEAFATALENVARAPPETSSMLEDDFTTNWPVESRFLPSVGREPVQRPASMFKPDKKREGIFGGFVFVFCDQAQYDTLQPPITNGNGKAFLYEVKPGRTSVREFMAYITEISDLKNNGNRGSLAPVIVQFNAPPEQVEWATDFIREVSLEMDQRMINQSEFLDAVVAADASSLRRPLPEEEASIGPSRQINAVSSSSVPADRPSQNDVPASSGIPPLPDSSAMQPASSFEGVLHTRPTKIGNDESQLYSQPPASSSNRRRPLRSATVQSRFKGFDDIDVADLPPPRSKLTMSNSKEEDDMEIDDDVLYNDASASQSRVEPRNVPDSRKRTARAAFNTASDAENEDDMMNGMLAGTKALKKHRLAEGQPLSDRPSEEVHLPTGQQILAQKPHPRKEVENINLKELVMNRREEEERRRLEDEEALRHAMDGVDISAIRGLAKVEEYQLTPRAPRSEAAAVGKKDNAPGLRDGVVVEREGWQNSWNGRKNFKKFRRKGEIASIRTSHRVIVPLEVAKTKGFGIEEEYWLGTSNSGSKSKSQSQNQTQSVQEVRETPLASQGSRRSKQTETPDDGSFRRRRNRAVPEPDIEIEDDVVEVPNTIPEDLSAPRNAMPAPKGKGRTANTQDTDVASVTNRKRPAAAVAVVDDRPSKRSQRTVEESDEEEGRFRFRRRR